MQQVIYIYNGCFKKNGLAVQNNLKVLQNVFINGSECGFFSALINYIYMIIVAATPLEFRIMDSQH